MTNENESSDLTPPLHQEEVGRKAGYSLRGHAGTDGARDRGESIHAMRDRDRSLCGVECVEIDASEIAFDPSYAYACKRCAKAIAKSDADLEADLMATLRRTVLRRSKS